MSGLFRFGIDDFAKLCKKLCNFSPLYAPVI
jgi:hypothetical protein